MKRATFVFQQWFSGLAVALLVFQCGIMGGWSSPTLAKLTAPGSAIPLDFHKASWVASLLNLGRLIGAIVGGILVSVLGSKRTIFVTLWPIAFGWFLIIMAKSAEWLYASRIISGIGLGMAYSSYPLYIGEISMPEIRGALIALATVGLLSGQLIASICGTYLSIIEAAIIHLTSALLLMVVFFWLPESPHHLIKTNNQKDAWKSIHWYRGGRNVDQELEAVEKFVTGNGKKSFCSKLREFKTRPVRRATFVIISLFALMQICGLNSVIFYMETILRNAKFTLTNPSLVVIYVTFSGIISAMISIFLIDRCGRRFLLVMSSAGATLAMLGLSATFFLINENKYTTDLQWVPMLSMFLFVGSFYSGLFSCPSTILSETFPADIKCIAACIATIVGSVTSFLSAKTYQPMVDYMGEIYVFIIYATSAFVIIPYTLFMVPETKGKSLQEIQNELIKK